MFDFFRMIDNKIGWTISKTKIRRLIIVTKISKVG